MNAAQHTICNEFDPRDLSELYQQLSRGIRQGLLPALFDMPRTEESEMFWLQSIYSAIEHHLFFPMIACVHTCFYPSIKSYIHACLNHSLAFANVEPFQCPLLSSYCRLTSIILEVQNEETASLATISIIFAAKMSLLLVYFFTTSQTDVARSPRDFQLFPVTLPW